MHCCREFMRFLRNFLLGLFVGLHGVGLEFLFRVRWSRPRVKALYPLSPSSYYQRMLEATACYGGQLLVNAKGFGLL